MGLNNEERYNLVKYKIEKAFLTLEEAKATANLKFWNATANRLYYSAYNATSALLIAHQINAQTHSGLIQMFGLHFIKTQILSKDEGRLLSVLFDNRQTGDYGDDYNLTEEQIFPLVTPTENFIVKITNMAKTKLEE